MFSFQKRENLKNIYFKYFAQIFTFFYVEKYKNFMEYIHSYIFLKFFKFIFVYKTIERCQ